MVPAVADRDEALQLLESVRDFQANRATFHVLTKTRTALLLVMGNISRLDPTSITISFALTTDANNSCVSSSCHLPKKNAGRSLHVERSRCIICPLSFPRILLIPASRSNPRNS